MKIAELQKWSKSWKSEQETWKNRNSKHLNLWAKAFKQAELLLTQMPTSTSLSPINNLQEDTQKSRKRKIDQIETQ